MKASDIPDSAFLANVKLTQAVTGTYDDGAWRLRWDVKATLEANTGLTIPEKVFLAKAKKLMARGLLGGCPCGCRGDYHIPSAQLYCCTGCDIVNERQSATRAEALSDVTTRTAGRQG